MKISIITATYNCEDYIESALKSVHDQTYDNVEHLVIDGGSSDGTIEKLKQFKFSKFISEADNGIYDALNKGIKYSSGDIVGFLHADDEFASKDVISSVASIFKSNSSISAVYGDLVYVLRQEPNRTIRFWKSKPFHSKLLSNGWMPPHPSLYVKRDFYNQIGGFNTDYKISADYFSILSLFNLPKFKPFYLPEVLVKMKLGGVSNRSLKAILNKSLEDWMILRKLNFNTIQATKALTLKNISKLKQLRF